jgi:hypothetical protein
MITVVIIILLIIGMIKSIIIYSMVKDIKSMELDIKELWNQNNNFKNKLESILLDAIKKISNE